jgi:hypothetical protein
LLIKVTPIESKPKQRENFTEKWEMGRVVYELLSTQKVGPEVYAMKSLQEKDSNL